MSLRIRLSRGGAKKRPFYRIVVADSRSPRDGRFIEQLGVYNPMPNPKVVDLDLERVDYWVGNGAQPTDVVQNLVKNFKAGKFIGTNEYIERNKTARHERQVAAAAAMGRLAIPEMMKAGYEKGLATGVVASAGTIAALIPPSILMVLYGIFAETSLPATNHA